MQPRPTVFDIFPSVEPKVIVATENDVLCGKDKSFAQHSGNRRYKALIDSQGLNYANAVTKQQKMDITKSIYESVRLAGGRFLEPNQGNSQWNELSDSKARDKISHALRFFVKQHHQRNGSDDTALATENAPVSIPMSTNSVPAATAPATTANGFPSTNTPPVSNAQMNLATTAPPHAIPLPPTVAPSATMVQQLPSTSSMNNPTNSVNSTFSSQHPLGLLGQAAHFLLSTSTPTSSINNSTMRSTGSYDAMNTLQSHELREIFQKDPNELLEDDAMEE